jgi:hypothetical protein
MTVAADRLTVRTVKRSVAGLSSRRIGFSPTNIHVGFMVDSVNCRGFVRTFRAPVGACVCARVRHLLNTGGDAQTLTL